MDVKIKILDQNATIPTYGTPFSAGCDLYSSSLDVIEIPPHKTVLIHTGIAMEIPSDKVALIYARSGLASKRSLAPANKVGVIDSDYRGEVMVALHNHSDETQKIEPKERIAQLVITNYDQATFKVVEELSDTLRGEGGFGSTGKK